MPVEPWWHNGPMYPGGRPEDDRLDGPANTRHLHALCDTGIREVRAGRFDVVRFDLVSVTAPDIPCIYRYNGTTPMEP